MREGVEADQIRSIEHERLRALVEADMEISHQLHANDFQLINPSGESLSREQYLGRSGLRLYQLIHYYEERLRE